MTPKNMIIGLLVIIVLVGGYFYFRNTSVAPLSVNPPAPTDTGNTPTPTPVPTVPPSASAPSVTTTMDVVVSNSTAVVMGHVNPNGAPTTYWYEYGETTGFGNRTAANTIGSGFTSLATPSYITGLRANTLYYFRLNAQNNFDTVRGQTYTFTTNSNPPPQVVAPTIQTQAATNVTRNTAQVNGSVNPHGVAATYWFEYGTMSGFGNVSGFTSARDGSTPLSVSAPISGLQPLTKYYFRLNAQNQFGTVNGSTFTFTTSGPANATAPSIDTTAATRVGTSSATLNGKINPNGGETSYWFEYSGDATLSTILGTTNPDQKVPAGTKVVTVSFDLSNLTSGKTYYYRLVAENFAGESKADIVAFKTK